MTIKVKVDDLAGLVGVGVVNRNTYKSEHPHEQVQRVHCVTRQQGNVE